MQNTIMKNTFASLKQMGVSARLSNVVISKSKMLSTPWTFSFVMHDDGFSGCGAGNHCHDIPFDISFIREFIDADVYEVAERIGNMESSTFRNSLLISLASALSNRVMADQSLMKKQGFDVRMVSQAGIGAITDQVKKTDTVAIVGYFYSYVSQLAGVARQINVTELTPPSDFDIYDFKPRNNNVRVFPANKNRDVLGNADIVIMTGMTLANDTALELLDYAKNARLVMMQGPTCSFYPKALFDAGADLVGAVLFPTDNGLHDRLVNSRGYWYYEKELKHVLISANKAK